MRNYNRALDKASELLVYSEPLQRQLLMSEHNASTMRTIKDIKHIVVENFLPLYTHTQYLYIFKMVGDVVVGH